MRRGCLAPGPGLLGVLEVLLESLQEELLVFGVRVARVVDVVVRGVDPRRRELHPVLKRSTIIRWRRRSHCYSNTGRPKKEILHPGERCECPGLGALVCGGRANNRTAIVPQSFFQRNPRSQNFLLFVSPRFLGRLSMLALLVSRHYCETVDLNGALSRGACCSCTSREGTQDGSNFSHETEF